MKIKSLEVEKITLLQKANTPASVPNACVMYAKPSTILGGASDLAVAVGSAEDTTPVTGAVRAILADHMVDYTNSHQVTLTQALAAGATEGKSLREIRIEGWHAKKGVAAPSDAERAVGASGGVLLPVLTFSKLTQQDCYFTIHTPLDLDPTYPAHFHLMWQPGASWTSGNYMWKCEYVIIAENGATLLSPSPATLEADVTPANATTNIETEIATDITLASDQLMICHFYRDVANDNADDIGCVTFFELEYTSKLLGEALP